MNKRKVFGLIFLFAGILTLFQNCGRKFEASGSSSQLSFCKVAPGKTSPFVSGKVLLKKSVFSAQQKLSQGSMKISLVVNPQCLEDTGDSASFLGEAIVLNERLKSQKKAALSIHLSGNPSMQELDNEMTRSPCFLGLTENPNVKGSVTLTPEPVNDPQSSEQEHLGFLGHALSRGLQKDIDPVRGRVVVAFVDSGIDYDHPDLSNRMWENTQGEHGYNYVNNTTDPRDDDGHGTHVAGIVGAIENNSYGVSGLTGEYVQLMAVKVLDNSGAGTSQNVYNGIQFAIANGADIINLSIESQGQNTLMEDAVIDAVNAGIVITSATGNQAQQISPNNLFAPAYIGAQIDGAITVASIDTSTISLSNFSNYSNTYAEISAPGAEVSAGSSISGGILSTAPGGLWSRIQGTSQATPMVTSAVALMIGYLKTQGITYTPSGLESFLKSDGAMVQSSIGPYVAQGKILQMGFLAENLAEYLLVTPSPDFTNGVTTGNTCVAQ